MEIGTNIQKLILATYAIGVVLYTLSRSGLNCGQWIPYMACAEGRFYDTMRSASGPKITRNCPWHILEYPLE
jgi:hypothetical protein